MLSPDSRMRSHSPGRSSPHVPSSPDSAHSSGLPICPRGQALRSPAGRGSPPLWPSRGAVPPGPLGLVARLCRVRSQHWVFLLLGVQSFALLLMTSRQTAQFPGGNMVGQPDWPLRGRRLRSMQGDPFSGLASTALGEGSSQAWAKEKLESLLDRLDDKVEGDADEEQPKELEQDDFDLKAAGFMGFMGKRRRHPTAGRLKEFPSPDEDLLGEMPSKPEFNFHSPVESEDLNPDEDVRDPQPRAPPLPPPSRRAARRAARSQRVPMGPAEPKQVRGSHLEKPSELIGLTEKEAEEYRRARERERKKRVHEVRAMFLRRHSSSRHRRAEAAPAEEEEEEGEGREQHLRTSRGTASEDLEAQVQPEFLAARDSLLVEVHRMALGAKRTVQGVEDHRQTVPLGDASPDYESAVAAAFPMPGDLPAAPPQCSAVVEASQTWRVVVSGMTRAAATWQSLVVRRLLELGGVLARGEAVALARGTVADVTPVLQNNRVVVAVIEDFAPAVLGLVDFVFVAHRDPRNEFAVLFRRHKALGFARDSVPELHAAFARYASWLPHACFDSKYEDILLDEAREIQRLGVLMCLPGVKPEQVLSDVKQMITRDLRVSARKERQRLQQQQEQGAEAEQEQPMGGGDANDSATNGVELESPAAPGEDVAGGQALLAMRQSLDKTGGVGRSLLEAMGSYDLQWLPQLTMTTIEQSMGAWLANRGYFFRAIPESSTNWTSSKALRVYPNVEQLLKADVIRMHNCPLPRQQ